MAQKPTSYSSFNGGIADFIREGIVNSFAFGRSIDVRSDPDSIGVLPRTVKESGSTIIDLPKWAETYPSTLTTYIYGSSGTIYSRTSAGSYTNLRTVNNSHGNGLVYSAEDDYLYYSLDKVIGRYGPLASASPSFSDDFLGAQGGVPLNTNSLDLESSSSQYASRADTATLSITGSIAMDIQIKPESLPTVGNQMVLMSKWDESGSTRSYKFDINTASGYFGDSSDGALTISVDTTEAPIDSAATGTTGTTSLTATNASFAASQIIFIHQSQGTGAGTWQRNTIQSYTAGTITTSSNLNATYGTGAQVRVFKQYSNVTINSGKIYTAKAWNGTVGGILGFIASGTVTVTGSISATGKGFAGGISDNTGTGATVHSGEGTVGVSVVQYSANGNGGGGGGYDSNQAAGGGGGNGTPGQDGQYEGGAAAQAGIGGAISGSADLTTMTFGGGGGNVHRYSNGGSAAGGAGGGIVFVSGATLTVSGSIVSNGVTGSVNTGDGYAGSGAGAGGSILLKAQTATLGTSITASGGSQSAGSVKGGAGGDGRIHLDYYTSYTGTTTPTLGATQDNSLVTNTTYQLRLSLSSTGANSETLAYDANIQTGTWQQVGVSWDSSTKIATFYLNAVSLGTRTGTLGAIHDNASTFQIGMSKNGAGAAANFYDGLMDEARLFNATRSTSDMLYGLNQQIAVNTTGLVYYGKLNGDYVDATANANNLTATNAPVFTSDVPYPSPTTRLDIDQSGGGTGNTYTLPAAISESATNRQTFTPAKDPQKSVSVSVAGVGTGSWTLTVHDSNNMTVASKTVANASMSTGVYEFVFSSVWRPLTNFTNTYHFHVTSSDGTGTVNTTTSADLEDVTFNTYYQFLVEDTAWHPMTRFLNFWVIGNERYVGKYEATLYEPNKITLQAGLRARCFALWREYLAIGVMKGTNIYDFDQGRIYFWDGYSPTFNFFIDVPEGGINAMLGARGKLYIWAGYKNQLLEYLGGDVAQKVKDMPKMEATKYSEVYPGAVTMWQSLLRYGVAGNGNSTAIQKGVYTYGSTNIRYPDILTYDYPISTSNYAGTSVKVGMTTVVNQKLLIGWQDNVSYGVDYVDVANSPFISSMVEFLMTDDDAVWKEKTALEVDAAFTTLLSGEAINLRYALDGSTSFTDNPDVTATGDTISRLILSNSRYHEAQVGIDITATTTAPTIKGLVFVVNTNDSEQRYG